MGFKDMVRTVESRDLSLTLYNRDDVDPVYDMLADFFDREFAVSEREDSDLGANAVVLREAGDELAVSTMSELLNSVLLVNSDLYITGAREIDEVETPEVVAALEDTTFTVQGKRKFLLIHLSRHIEAMAYEAGTGVLHAGFQYVSRMKDERGTEDVYQRLGATDVDVHVYGYPDEDLGPAVVPDGVALHEKTNDEIASSWFVTFDGAGDDADKGALVAVQDRPTVWDGYYTFEPAEVDRVHDYVESTYLAR